MELVFQTEYFKSKYVSFNLHVIKIPKCVLQIDIFKDYYVISHENLKQAIDKTVSVDTLQLHGKDEVKDFCTFELSCNFQSL